MAGRHRPVTTLLFIVRFFNLQKWEIGPRSDAPIAVRMISSHATCFNTSPFKFLSPRTKTRNPQVGLWLARCRHPL
jgi:hypothetical protein